MAKTKQREATLELLWARLAIDHSRENNEWVSAYLVDARDAQSFGVFLSDLKKLRNTSPKILIRRVTQDCDECGSKDTVCSYCYKCDQERLLLEREIGEEEGIMRGKKEMLDEIEAEWNKDIKERSIGVNPYRATIAAKRAEAQKEARKE
jgi:hypothetical protein